MGGLTKVGRVRSANEVLAECRDLVEPALRAAVSTLPDSTQRIAGYHFGWLDERGQPASGNGGKAIRPALTLLAASAVGAGPGVAVPGAAAVELVHNFSLVHDDVLDGDATRRHRATAWTVFGRSGAILAGSAMLALAYDVLASSGHPAAEEGMRILSAAVQDLLDGQSADVAFESRSDVGVSEVLRMSEAKTAALLGSACALGGLLGGGSPGAVESLRNFGRHLGLAFQFTDDLLGIWGDPAVTGKPVYSDLQSRKKSLPVVAALCGGTAAGAELASLYGVSRVLTEAELSRAASLVEQSGARDWSRDQADELLARAMGDLAQARAPARVAAELTAIARLATHRIR